MTPRRLDHDLSPRLHLRQVLVQQLPEEMAAERVQVLQLRYLIDQSQILGQKNECRLCIDVSALHAAEQLAQEVEHRAPAEMLEIGDVRAERAAHRAEAGDVWPVRLVEQDTVDRVGGEIVLYLFKKPGAKSFMIIAGEDMSTPVAVLHALLRVAESI